MYQRSRKTEYHGVSNADIGHAVHSCFRHCVRDLKHTSLVRLQTQIHAHRHKAVVAEIVMPIELVLAARSHLIHPASETADWATASQRIDDLKQHVIVDRKLQQGRAAIRFESHLMAYVVRDLLNLRVREFTVNFAEQPRIEKLPQHQAMRSIEFFA
jgi:hypothetical protein